MQLFHENNNFITMDINRKIFRSWFKYLILTYIIVVVTFTFSKNTKNFIELPFIQEAKFIIEKQFRDPDLKFTFDSDKPIKISGSSQLHKENTPAYSGAIQVTSGVTFKMITPVDEIWRKRIIRRVQLYGVESCEPRQFALRNGVQWPCGFFVTAWLVSKTIDKNVTCKQARVVKQIHYAQCFVDGVDIASLGLSEGMMLLPKDQHNFPSPAHYKELQFSAQKAKIGLWSGDFEHPEDWRRRNGTYNPIDPH
ncbi:nuclease [Bartonella schoenbuchensis]